MPTPSDLIIDLSEVPSGLNLSGKVAEALALEIRRGRLGPGARLPSSRRLATQLGVHRNTVLAALDDLIAQGYVRTEVGRGVYVSDQLPRVVPSRRAGTKPLMPADFPLAHLFAGVPSLDVRPTDLPLLGGLPDLRLTPIKELARAYRSALHQPTVTLDYQSERGQPRFLKAFGQFLRETRGVVTGDGGLMTTRGSQQALFLAARVLCAPGQVLAVEALGYPPAWEAFRLAGAQVRPVRVDRGGLVISELARLADTERIAAVYVTPHHQYPTTVTMSGPRRAELLRLAESKRFFIIEDDYDHEFHFEGRPVLPLASFDRSSLVVHTGTFSKVFAPGLRLGYVAGQPRIVDAMCAVRRVLDRQGDHVQELALAHMIEDGVFSAHLRRAYRAYAERRAVLFEQLESKLGERLQFRRPSGGLAVWARVHARPSPKSARPGPHLRLADATFAERWAEAARSVGVLVQPGRQLSFDGRPRAFLRLGYPRLNPDELRRAVGLLARSYPKV